MVAKEDKEPKKSPLRPVLQQDPNATPEALAKALLGRVTPYENPEAPQAQAKKPMRRGTS